MAFDPLDLKSHFPYPRIQFFWRAYLKILVITREKLRPVGLLML